jgi:hypothetical protein
MGGKITECDLPGIGRKYTADALRWLTARLRRRSPRLRRGSPKRWRR